METTPHPLGLSYKNVARQLVVDGAPQPVDWDVLLRRFEVGDLPLRVNAGIGPGRAGDAHRMAHDSADRAVEMFLDCRDSLPFGRHIAGIAFQRRLLLPAVIARPSVADRELVTADRHDAVSGCRQEYTVSMSDAYSDGKKLQGADEFDPRTLPPFPPTDRTGDVDMSLIDCNLRLTPAERIAQHDPRSRPCCWSGKQEKSTVSANLELLKRLTDAGVDYVLVGGLAGIAHGSALVTYDIDVCVRSDNVTVSRILDALRPINPRHRMRPDLMPLADDPLMLTGLKNLYIKTSIGEIDFLGEISGVGSLDEVKAHSQTMKFDEHLDCRVLDLDTLIVAKRSAGRSKDLRAVVELEAIRRRLRGEQP